MARRALSPEFAHASDATRYDESRRRVHQRDSAVVSRPPPCARTSIRPFDLDSSGFPYLPGFSGPKPLGCFATIRKGRCGWLARLDFVSRAVPELKWPDFSDDVFAELLDQVCHGKAELDQVKQTDLIPILQSRLDRLQSRELQRKLAGVDRDSQRPPRTAWPMNRGGRPSCRHGLQELFGWTETPRAGARPGPVLLHVLGPNNRPVQITDDLNSFWKMTYHQVRKDLRGRYPKHAWPENPCGPNRLQNEVELDLVQNRVTHVKAK